MKLRKFKFDILRDLSLIVLLLASIAQAQTDVKIAILPAREARIAGKYYPPPGGKKITGGWLLTNVDIAPIEARLAEIAQMTPRGWPSSVHVSSPDKCFRQYIGVLQEGKKRIYLNAFCVGDEESKLSRDWHLHFYWVMDGDLGFWQVIYDPATRKFIGFQINPRA